MVEGERDRSARMMSIVGERGASCSRTAEGPTIDHGASLESIGRLVTPTFQILIVLSIELVSIRLPSGLKLMSPIAHSWPWSVSISRRVARSYTTIEAPP